jgi:hypothetical protein
MSSLPTHLQAHADAIPSDVRSQLGPAETYARAAEAHRIVTRADGLGLSPNDHRAWRDRATAVLGAMPRVQLDQQLADLAELADAAPDHVLRRGYRERSAALVDQHPQVSDDDLAAAERAVSSNRSSVDHLMALKAARDRLAAGKAKSTPLTRAAAPAGYLYKTG